MAYSWITFAQAKTALKNRLGDSAGVFWLDAELGEYIKEALRTWNVVAQYHHDRVTFLTQSGFNFYDLTSTANPNSITAGTGAGATNPPAMMGYTVKDRDLINLIQYHLIEPITTNWASPVFTEQYTMEDLVRSIERRRNQLLLECAPHLSHSLVSYGSPPGSGRVSLTDSIISVRRAAWKSFTGDYSPLWRTDEQGGNAFAFGWADSPSTPTSYSMIMTPKVMIQLIPLSNDVGSVDLITVNAPANLDQTVGTLLNIPDDWSWIAKFGALGDLFSQDSQSFDPLRYEYCEKRWLNGLEIAAASATLQQAEVDGLKVQPSSLAGWDAFKPEWQGVTVGSGNPITDIAIAGRNLITLYPIPDVGPHSVELDILENAPMPASDGAFLQIGREEIDVLLDYAYHLAMLKVGGAEFQATITLADRFMRLALQHNDILRAEAENYSIMNGFSKRDMVERPRREEAATNATGQVRQ